jgi:hypothetical protein
VSNRANTSMVDVAALMKTASDTLLTLQANNVKLAAENSELAAQLTRKDLAADIVELLENRGQGDSRIPFREKVAALLDSGQDLATLKQALLLQPPAMGFAKVAEKRGNAGGSPDDRLLDAIYHHST